MTPEFISQWLSQQAGTVEEQEIRSLLEQYPYFVPARYMEAQLLKANGNKKHYDLAHDYSVNHILFEILTSVPTTAKAHVIMPEKTEELIQPLYTEDYFRQQGVIVDDAIPEEMDVALKQKEAVQTQEDPKSLMVMMSFADWLMHFKSTTEKEKEEEESRRALKTHWQKEKLAAALEEDDEDDEIPEDVFQMAVNSISKEDGLVSESLADILVKQKKWDKAIDMYKKLSLRNPQKSTYFAAQIEAIQKENNS